MAQQISSQEVRLDTVFCAVLCLAGSTHFHALSLALPSEHAPCISGPPQAAVSRVSFQQTPCHSAPAPALDGTAHTQEKCQLSTTAIQTLPSALNPL